MQSRDLQMSNAPDLILQLASDHPAGTSLHQAFYTDPDLFAFDLTEIFLKNWIFAGHASRIPNSGDYFTYLIGREDLVVVRDADHQVRAFFNVCTHRGTILCEAGSGNTQRFTCPYHGWTFDLGGNLIAARLMPDGFDKSLYGLHGCQVRLVDDLIFIHAADRPPDIEDVFNDVERYVKPHGLRDSKVCFSHTLSVEANWKIVAENFWECYHCSLVHPQFSSTMTYPAAMFSERTRNEQQKFVEDWERSLPPEWRGLPRRKPVNGAIHRCERIPIRPGFMTQSKDGLPVAPLMGDFKEYDGGVTGIQIFPIVWFSLCNDHAVLTRFTPIETQLTEIEFTWLVKSSAIENHDYTVDEITWLWLTTGLQDKRVCELNQKGINSTAYKPGALSQAEIDVMRFHDWYLRQITA